MSHTATPGIAQSSSSSIENLAYQQSNNTNGEFSSLGQLTSDEIKKICYVCHSTEDENNDQWVAPCKCIGSLKYVHQNCIQQWVDTQLKNNQNNKMSCPQCKTEYIVLFPNSSKFVYCLELLDKTVSAFSPYLVGTIFLSSVYWSAFSFGALTVLQTMGFERGRAIIESSDPITLFVMLPAVPVILILSKFVNWEDHYLRLWRNHHKSLPILKFFFKEPPVETGRESCEKILLGRENFHSSITVARMICSALLLPSISNLIGNYFFRDATDSVLHRTLLGGASFVLIKGLFKIYLRQSQYIKHSNRRILNYHDASNDEEQELNGNQPVEIDDSEA